MTGLGSRDSVTYIKTHRSIIVKPKHSQLCSESKLFDGVWMRRGDPRTGYFKFTVLMRAIAPYNFDLVVPLTLDH